ncbi:DExH-box ATP-dependent RNA helicase DExH1 [Diplonema papillatum]|nr:DExH-box ATP-dependent RNA helicase DExH1 [Diplonema papillatum]
MGGKGKGKGKGIRLSDDGGGSLLRGHIRAQMEAKKEKKRMGSEANLGTLGLSQENHDLVSDVLRNVREGIDEHVKGLDHRPVTQIKCFDSSLLRERNALTGRGIPVDVVDDILKEMPTGTTDARVWPAVRRAMENIAEDAGGALTDGTAWDADDSKMARDTEIDVLKGLLDPDAVRQNAGDGTLEVALKLAVPDKWRADVEGARVVFSGCGADAYPSRSPLALLVAPGLPKAVKLEANASIWTRITTDLVGQPVVFEIVTETENKLPTLLEEYDEQGCPEPPPPAAGPRLRRGRGRGGGKSVSKGGGKSLAAATSKQQGKGPPRQKVPQLFPELELAEIEQITAGSGADGGGRAGGPGIDRNEKTDKTLRDAYFARVKNGAGMPEQRRRLPAAKQEDEIVDVIRKNQVVLITGETGCGKTTQVPQFVLDDAMKNGEGSGCRIICTQPRRIAATSIAKRVASERGTPLGREIGYSIRLESKQSAETRLLFCTTGVLLRRLQADNDLQAVSHIVVDEVHERSLDSDFLLIFLKDLVTRRSDLKVILMSASVNAELFSGYFHSCPVAHIPGFTHPVEEYYLENILEVLDYRLEEDSPYSTSDKYRSVLDHEGGGTTAAKFKLKELQKKDKDFQYKWETLSARFPNAPPAVLDVLLRMSEDKINNELIAELIREICCGKRLQAGEGAILVFLPGMQEINALYEEITSDRRLASVVSCHRLHSSVSNVEQDAVFNKPPRGLRKVVLSTNIAETSVTIDDVVYVIDSGKHKENRYEAKQSMVKLVSCWVSQANAKQRRGRAGRVRPGRCFRLYTSYVHDSVMASFQDCEMRRVPLQNLLLQIRVLHFGTATDTDVLSRAIESPSDVSVTSCRSSLQEIGALGPTHKLTSLGLHLANFPLDPKLGKLLLHGVLLRCLDPCLTIAAALQSKTPFVTPYDRKLEADQIKQNIANNSKSDHIAVVNAYNAWLVVRTDDGYTRGKEREHASKYFVSLPALQQIQLGKKQLFSLLADQGWVRPEGEAPFVTTVVGDKHVFELGGKDLNQYSVQPQAVKAAITAGFTPNIVRIRPGTSGKGPRFYGRDAPVNIHPSSVCGNEKQFPYPLVAYYEKVMTTSVFLRDATMITPQMLLLFAVELEHNDDQVIINQWISFNMAAEVLLVISELRKELQNMIAELVKDPDTTLKARHANIVGAVMKLLREERIASPDGGGKGKGSKGSHKGRKP